jgi:hypothetical protein
MNERRQRRVEAEEAVEVELGAGRDRERGARRVVERVAVRHDERERVGAAAQEEGDDDRLRPGGACAAGRAERQEVASV